MADNQVDIDVQVETSNVVIQELNQRLYAAALVYNSSVGTRVRTYCANPSGHVMGAASTGVLAAAAFHEGDTAQGMNLLYIDRFEMLVVDVNSGGIDTFGLEVGNGHPSRHDMRSVQVDR